MVASPHILIGALASSRRRSLGGAFLAGVASHLAADRVPHSDYDPRGGAGKLRGLADLALGGGLLFALSASPVQLAGALGGIAPDLTMLATGSRDPFSRLVHIPNHTASRPGRLVGVGLQSVVALCAYATLRSRSV